MPLPDPAPGAAAPLPALTLWRYALLGLPLAMVALPVYVHLPRFWHQAYGLGLGGIGVALLAARALDALQDPLLGAWSDRLAAGKPGGRARMLGWSAPVTGAGLLALFDAPTGLPEAALWAWMLAALAVCYFGFSALTISYTALAADLHAAPHQRTRLAGTREALGLLGVMVAAAAPEVLAKSMGLVAGYRWFAVALVPLLVLCAWVSAGSARAVGRAAGTVAHAPAAAGLRGLWQPLAHAGLRRLLQIYLLSGVAAAIPASLVLFFIQDVVARPDLAGAFLGAYFLAGALGMPVWIRLARRLGRPRAWATSMALAIAAFAWAAGLQAGDAAGYFAVCLAAGLAFGADLALPPALLSDLASRAARQHEDASARTANNGSGGSAANASAGLHGGAAQGTWFGLWALVGKLNLALGAGLSLPLVSWLGYVPGAAGGSARLALAGTYAVLPCLLKLAALALLWRQRGALEPPPDPR